MLVEAEILQIRFLDYLVFLFVNDLPEQEAEKWHPNPTWRILFSKTETIVFEAILCNIRNLCDRKSRIENCNFNSIRFNFLQNQKVRRKINLFAS